MKRLQPPRIPSSVWIVVALTMLVLAFPLAWWLRQPVRDLLLQPATGSLWRLRNFARMVPQTDLWLGLVILGGVNVAFLLLRQTRLRMPPPPVPLQKGRVDYWLGTLRVGRQARRLLIRPLRSLVVQVIAHSEHKPRDEILSQLQGGTLPIPDHLQDFLSDRPLQRARAPVAGSLPQRRLPYPPELEEVVRMLEDYLEVPHES